MERGEKHRRQVERREYRERADDPISLKPAKVEHRETRLAPPVDSLVQDRGESGAESERYDRHRRRNRLRVREPQHHRLHRRDVDDAGARAHQETVAQVDERQ